MLNKEQGLSIDIIQKENKYTVWIVFVTVSMTYVMISWTLQHYVLTKAFYIHNLSNNLTLNQIQYILNLRHKWLWLGYLFIPVSVLIKIGYASIAINIGFILFDIDLGFKPIFQAVLAGESVFIIASLIKLSGYLWWHPVHSAIALSTFAPLTLASLLNLSKIPRWFWYPLQSLSVYDIAYCFIISGYLAYYFKKDFKELLGDVIISYGSALILWMGIVVFLSLQMGL